MQNEMQIFPLGSLITMLPQTLQLMHTSLGMGLPQQFFTPKIRKLVKNLVYFGLYCRGLLGERHQIFPRDVTLQGIKISASNVGALEVLPLNFGTKKT